MRSGVLESIVDLAGHEHLMQGHGAGPVSREKLEDGRFRIVYRGDFRDDSFADVAADWLKKHGERRQAY